MTGGLSILAWKGGVGKKLLWKRDYENLVVNVARKCMSRLIGGNAAIIAHTPSVEGITITDVSQLFVKYMKWSYDSAKTDPQLTDTTLDGVVVTDISGAITEAEVLSYFPTTSNKAVTFRACIGSIPASVSGMTTLLVPTGTQFNQEGIFTPGDNITPVRLLFAKRLFETITVGADMVYECRHTLIF